MNIAEMKEYLLAHEYSTYERSAYDKFLKDVKFSFPIKAIHITGTNGKGSVANYLYNIYLSSGLKVGLYNSPYLEDVEEMISVNHKNITDNEYLELFDRFLPKFKKYNLSAFEIETFIAYTYFIEQKVDLVIIEVGMGGYIDATNVITPILSIITSVSLEHTSYLGRSISEIAENKAGIIKDEVPVLVGRLDDSAMFAIREHAKEYGAPLYIVDEYHNEKLVDGFIHFDYIPLVDIKLNTKAIYQAKNASIAIEATRILKDILATSEKDIRDGLFCSTLNCRLEYINDHILLDGAHNFEAMESLVDTLSKIETRPIHVLFACFKDKNLDAMLNSLAKVASSILLTTFDHKRARGEDEYFLYLGDYEYINDYKEGLKNLLATYPDDLILVTGSLAFSGVVRKYLKDEH